MSSTSPHGHSRRSELAQRLSPVLRLGLELEPVDADVRGAVDADDPPRVLTRPSAHERKQPVAAGEAFELRARLRRDGGVLRPRDDRRERAVHVQDDGGALRLAARRATASIAHRKARGNPWFPREPPPLRPRTPGDFKLCRAKPGAAAVAETGSDRLRMSFMGLVIVGLVAGLFSALFGVGGGIVIVPMLLLLHRYTARVAMATSLVSIAFVADRRVDHVCLPRRGQAGRRRARRHPRRLRRRRRERGCSSGFPRAGCRSPSPACSSPSRSSCW